jgi:type III restriction enzyme
LPRRRKWSIQQTIDIPRILVVPTGKVQSGFNPFTLKLDTLKYPPVDEELWAKHLRTDQVDVIAMGKAASRNRVWKIMS